MSSSTLLSDIHDKSNKESYKIANLDAIINTPNIENGSYSNLTNVEKLTGYVTDTRLKNFNTFEGTLTTQSSGGFTNLIDNLASGVQPLQYQI